MKEKTYKIQAQVLKQGPLTLRQMRGFAALVSGLDADDISVGKLAEKLASEKIVEFMTVLFPEHAEKIDWEQVTYEQIDEVIEDFLSLNPRLIKRLRSLFASLASMQGDANQA